MLVLVAWLLSFKTYHVVTEHYGEKAHHHHHHHAHGHKCCDAPPKKAGFNLPACEAEDCSICDLISLPFTGSSSFDISILVKFSQALNSFEVASVLLDERYYTFDSRGPPVFFS